MLKDHFDAIKNAVTKAIDSVGGIEGLKKTSMFPSSLKMWDNKTSQYHDGYYSYSNGVKLEENPFSTKTQIHSRTEWDEGWLHAQEDEMKVNSL
jgi:ribosome modulation factor